MLSRQNWLLRQLLGAQFDLIDVIPLVVAHWILRARTPAESEA